MDLAWQLAAVGRIDDALQAYADAAQLLPRGDGAAHLAAALLHVERTGDLEMAAQEVGCALERDPTLLNDLETELDAYRALRGTPGFEQAVERASLRLQVAGGDEPGVSQR